MCMRWEIFCREFTQNRDSYLSSSWRWERFVLQVVPLMRLDAKRTVALLVQQRNKITAAEVVSQLRKSGKDQRFLLHSYLHALSETDPNYGKEFHDLQVFVFHCLLLGSARWLYFPSSVLITDCWWVPGNPTSFWQRRWSCMQSLSLDYYFNFW